MDEDKFLCCCDCNVSSERVVLLSVPPAFYYRKILNAENYSPSVYDFNKQYEGRVVCIQCLHNLATQIYIKEALY